MSDLDFPILLVHDPAEASPAIAEGVRYIAEALAAQGLAIVNARGEEEAELIVKTRPELSCVLMSWDDPDHDPGGGRRIERLIRLVREIQESLPIFLLTESLRVDELPHEVLQETSGYVWITEDKPEFSAGRIARAAEGYRRSLMPPFFRRLYDYVNEFKDAWHTPGHSGGLAFLKSPVGKIFYDFYGPNIFLTDLCSSVPEMGSLLEHQGVIREAEDEAAEAHGADRTFFVTNGTTMSNQIVHRALLKAGDVVVVDRNCHKSVINACIMTGAIPVFLPAHRNGQGIIGPARWEALDPEAIRARVAAHPLVRRKAGAVDPGAADAAGGGRVGSGAAEAAAAAGRDGVGGANGSVDSETGLASGSSRVPAPRVKMVVITNSTYDGVLYNAERLLRRLEGVADYIHMDEAWIPYAAFHPLYRRHYGLSPATRRKDLPTVISTVSTHKVLSAFSQASMIHIRNGRRPIDEDRFNEAFMMHTSTSPQYAILASLDVGTRMMMGKAGERLVQEAVERALEFRRQVYSIHREAEGRGDWWFNVWQPETVEAVFAAAGDVPGKGWEAMRGGRWPDWRG
ncbi:Orn/Lys/Arg decarboxylase N-terminal domain-containing protein [Kyrpidia spormannii]|uniref:Lysine decarboxylase n=1 Tax=Kyrpidia spormannii TaxID=2055160 RepID=A0ACA8ZDY4_9BACL